MIYANNYVIQPPDLPSDFFISIDNFWWHLSLFIIAIFLIYKFVKKLSSFDDEK